MRRVFVFLFVVLLNVFYFPYGFRVNKVHAQVKSGIEDSTSGVAVYVQIVDKNVQEGDIISLSRKGYALGTVPYDPNLYGVVVKNPAVAFESDIANSYPVVAQGKVLLRVSTINGKIKKGDLLTSSTMPGVGQKSTESGFVIATALEDYNANSIKDVGKILVVLDVGHGAMSSEERGNLFRSINFLLNTPYLSPLSVARYIFASLMVIISFGIAIGYFGRISSLGIEALGRNPLAGRAITFGIVLHIMLSLVILGIGIAVAYLTLVL